MEIDLKAFGDIFDDLTDSLNGLIIPFGLFSIRESKHICEGEAREDFEKSLKDFKIAYLQTFRHCKSLIYCDKPITDATNKKLLYTVLMQI